MSYKWLTPGRETVDGWWVSGFGMTSPEVRTSPDYKEYLSTWVEYKSFCTVMSWVEYSTHDKQCCTQTQLKVIRWGPVTNTVSRFHFTPRLNTSSKSIVPEEVDFLQLSLNITYVSYRSSCRFLVSTSVMYPLHDELCNPFDNPVMTSQL